MNFKRYHESKNLFDKTADYTTGTTTYNYTINGLDPNKYYTCSTNFERISGVTTASLYFNGGDSINNGVWSGTPRTFRPNSNGEITVYIRYRESASAPPIIDDVMAGTIWVMVNEGSTPLPYEPYSSEVWHDIPHYIHNTSTDTITTPAVLYPNDTTATVGLKGQMEQSSTPSPSSPIQPSECGERTGNLFDKNWLVEGYTLDFNTGLPTSYEERIATISPVDVSDVTQITVSYTVSGWQRDILFIYSIFKNGSLVERMAGNNSGDTVNIGDADELYLCFYDSQLTPESKITPDNLTNLMVNSGSTALPYEPYGQYKIPILSANTTTPVYLGEVQSTRKIGKYIFTGDENITRSVSASNVRMYYVISSAAGASPLYCTHFVDYAQAAGYPPVGYCNFNNISNFIMGVDGTEFETADDFKTWLRTQYTNGNPLTVWYILANETTGIVNEPLRKIGNYADEVSGISIPTIAGANTLSVDTTLQPSEVTVNYKGWHPVQSVYEYENGAWD